MQQQYSNLFQDQIINIFEGFPSLESFLGADQNLAIFKKIREKIKNFQKSLFFSHFLKSDSYLEHPALEKTQNELFFNLLEDENNFDVSPLHLFIKSYISTLPPMNNVGDPYEKNDPSAKKRFLLEVIDFFASKTKFKKKNEKLNFLIGFNFWIISLISFRFVNFNLLINSISFFNLIIIKYNICCKILIDNQAI